MVFKILTIFPRILDSYLNESILKRAQKNGAIKIETHDLRHWTNDKHKTVDDAPYGGGAGMLIKADVILEALNEIKSKKSKIVLLSARGKTWNQKTAKQYSKLNEIILICGRYEGVDERVKKMIDAEISIGNFVLTGGEIGALTIIDSVARILPGVLGNAKSAQNESHVKEGVLEYPQYTRPEVLEIRHKKYYVPKVLLSGNHKKIFEWREKHKKITTS